MGRIIQRKMSGYILDLPERLKLFVTDGRTGQRIEIKDDLDFWMRTRFSYFTEVFEKQGLDGFKSFE